jgi:MerR family copper efflux transcriptional regulator
VTKNFLIRREFIKEAKISEKVLKEWETVKIIKPKGFTEDNIPFYTLVALTRVNNIKKFLVMGYTLVEVQEILKKIGLPRNNESQEKSNELKKHLTIGGLAERVGVSSRTIKHWEDKGIIEPDMRSEGGFRLYSQAFVYLCNLIKDLQLFGYTLEQIKVASDYFREFLAISENIGTYSKEETEKKLDTMLLAIKELTEKMTLLKEGISRWEDLIDKKKKEIDTLKRKNQKKETPGEKKEKKENHKKIKGENHE